MLTTSKGITAKLIGLAAKHYQKVIRNNHEKKIKKDRSDLLAALMLGSIRRVK